MTSQGSSPTRLPGGHCCPFWASAPIPLWPHPALSLQNVHCDRQCPPCRVLVWARGGAVANPGSWPPEARGSGSRPSSPSWPWVPWILPLPTSKRVKPLRLGFSSLWPGPRPSSPAQGGLFSQKPRLAGSPSLRAALPVSSSPMAQPGPQGLLQPYSVPLPAAALGELGPWATKTETPPIPV